MYSINVTAGFKNSFENLPEQIIGPLDRIIKALMDDPFQSIPQARRLHNIRDRYRAKIGRDYRLIYRIEKAVNRVILLMISTRQHVYKSEPGGSKVLDDEQSKGILLGFKPGSSALNITHNQIIEEIEYEGVSEWITTDELWLLDIDEKYHDAINSCNSAIEIDSSVPSDIKKRLLDYSTNPNNSQIGKLYSLDGTDIKSLATRPLREFLLQLDNEQQKVIDRQIDSGPILVKGGPGTGKSLIGLYRIFHMVINRTSESMFTTNPRFGVLTYTNTLADLNNSLTNIIKEKLRGEGEVICSTLDKITFDLAKRSLGRNPSVGRPSQLQDLYNNEIIPHCGESAITLLKKLGIEYFIDEIELVILGYGIDSINDYRAHKRVGRGVGLTAENRNIIWSCYERFLELHRERNIESWGLLRQLALSYLVQNDTYPRFNALFVDEVQDLSRISRKIFLNLVSDKRFLIMTADTGQSIYEMPLTWQEVDPGLNLKGKVYILRRNYRTSKEIYKAIESLRVETIDGETATQQPVPVFSGPRPIWLNADGNSQLTKLTEAINHLLKRHHYGQIGIIVRDHKHIRNYLDHLKNIGIPACQVSKDKRIDIDAKHVHLITAHSSKGLEFPAVILPDVSDSQYPNVGLLSASQEPEGFNEEVNMGQRLFYVALSRACHSLVMIENTDNPSRFLKLLNPADWDMQ